MSSRDLTVPLGIPKIRGCCNIPIVKVIEDHSQTVFFREMVDCLIERPVIHLFGSRYGAEQELLFLIAAEMKKGTF